MQSTIVLESPNPYTKKEAEIAHLNKRCVIFVSKFVCILDIMCIFAPKTEKGHEDR